jgi:Uma2 family endonuclease
MATAALTRYTPEEYLAIDRMAEFKSEYIDGRIVAMTGGQWPHVVIGVNLIRETSGRLLDSPCLVFGGDMRVKVDASGRYVYSDMCIACRPQYEAGSVDVLVNPVVIVEVLSESTERYDRGDKFLHYRRIDTLREYVLVSQDKVLVECFTREGEFWRLTSLDDLDGVLTLTSVGVEIPLRRIYLNVFPAEGAPADDPRKDAG